MAERKRERLYAPIVTGEHTYGEVFLNILKVTVANYSLQMMGLCLDMAIDTLLNMVK